MIMEHNTELIIYQIEDGKTKINVNFLVFK